MAVTDDVGKFFKNIGNKATDTFNTAKLGGEVRDEEKAIDRLFAQLGEKYYEDCAASGQSDPAYASFIDEVNERKKNIARLQAEIEEIKAQGAAQQQKPAQPGTFTGYQQVDAQPAEEAPAQTFCSQCGAANKAGAKFCNKCGAKIE